VTETSAGTSTQRDAARGIVDTAGTPHRALVVGARTALVMLLIAGLALLGLGFFIALRGDPDPEVSGWLREVFGRVFLAMAVGVAAFLGVPSLVGLWAMSGANRPDAMRAFGRPVRRAVGSVAIGVIVVTAFVLLATGSAYGIVNLGLFGIVALATFGLAGAVAFSPHRGRAMLSAVALGAFVVATAWILVTAFTRQPTLA
jgi:hypothetical protein